MRTKKFFSLLQTGDFDVERKQHSVDCLRSINSRYPICALVWLVLSACWSGGDARAIGAAAIGAGYGLFTLHAYAALVDWMDKSGRTQQGNLRLALILTAKLALLAGLLALTIRATAFELYLGLGGFFLNLLSAVIWARLAAVSPSREQ